MKAKIKATGEIVEIVSYGVDGSYTNYVDNDGKFFQTTLNYYTEIEKRDSIDWEQRRYEIAKAMMAVAERHNNDPSGFSNPTSQAQYAIECADALIEELKKGGSQYGKD